MVPGEPVRLQIVAAYHAEVRIEYDVQCPVKDVIPAVCRLKEIARGAVKIFRTRENDFVASEAVLV